MTGLLFTGSAFPKTNTASSVRKLAKVSASKTSSEWKSVVTQAGVVMMIGSTECIMNIIRFIIRKGEGNP
jgi:hypothetical protein